MSVLCQRTRVINMQDNRNQHQAYIITSEPNTTTEDHIGVRPNSVTMSMSAMCIVSHTGMIWSGDTAAFMCCVMCHIEWCDDNDVIEWCTMWCVMFMNAMVREQDQMHHTQERIWEALWRLDESSQQKQKGTNKQWILQTEKPQSLRIMNLKIRITNTSTTLEHYTHWCTTPLGRNHFASDTGTPEVY